MLLRGTLLVSFVVALGAIGGCSSGADSSSSGAAVAFSGTYIPTAGKANAELATLVVNDDGTYRFARANCTGTACRSQGTATFDGTGDLALKDGTSGAVVHFAVGEVEAASPATSANGATTESVRPLDGAGLVSSSGGSLVTSGGDTTLVTAASSASSRPIVSASLDGVPMKRVAPKTSPRIVVNLPVGQDTPKTKTSPAVVYASDSSIAYDHPEEWSDTLDVTNVLQLWEAEIGFVFANPNQLAATVASRHLQISVETTPLETWWCETQHGYPASGTLQAREDFVADKTATDVLTDFAPIYAAGAEVTYAALDSDGISTVTTSDPSNGCQFTVEEAVQTQIKFMKRVHATYPNIQFGLLPNFPNYVYDGTSCFTEDPTSCDASFPGRDFSEVIDTQINMIQNNGESVYFVHVDNPYNYLFADALAAHSTLPPVSAILDSRILPLRDQVVGFGIRFGLIANTELIGVDGAAGDQAFADETIAETKFVAHHGLGDEDDFVVESWMDYPSVILPETTANTFTNVANSAIYELLGDTGRTFAPN